MINLFGISLGIFSIIAGIIWIIKKDKLKTGYCKNWPDRAFYVWGLTGIISGILLILNSNLLRFLLIIDATIFFGQRYYYNRKSKSKK